ncbi:MAG: hypothetical protein Q9166_005849 [cf. Caloplaca sp. 2 TL-2023]
MVLITAAAFAASTFDYLIAGGGTAGLTLAARLSENPMINVGVIEAGFDRSSDPKVLTPGLATSMWGDGDYDWTFETVEQTNGRVVAHPRGKILGGSSAINLNLWTHASQKDIDDWGALGNEGWSWADLLPYYKKSENFLSPPETTVQQEDINFVDPSCHGEGGPVENKFPPFYSDFYDSWSPTFANLKLSAQNDPKCGLGLGGATTLVSFNDKNARSYAGNTYFTLSASRPNLQILTNALVSRINFQPQKDENNNVVATGLTYTSDGTTYTANATREVLITAGTFQSPQLLELSGIGSSAVLNKYGIPVLYDNPAVGENLQDHLLVPLGFEAAPGESTQEDFRNLSLVQQALELYATDHTGPLAASTPTAYLSYKQLLGLLLPSQQPPMPRRPTAQIASGTSQGYAKQSQLTLNKLLTSNEAAAQMLFIPGGTTPSDVSNTSIFLQTDLPGKYFTLFGVLEHPFSRGFVHINSPDVNIKPTIDPKYLSNPLDLIVINTIVLAMQRIAQTAPLSTHLAANGTILQPGFPSPLSIKNVADLVKKSYSSEYHPLGTCAMAPRGASSASATSSGGNGMREELEIVERAGEVQMTTRGNTVSRKIDTPASSSMDVFRRPLAKAEHVNARKNRGDTALHALTQSRACSPARAGGLEALKTLVGKGIDICAVKNGMKPAGVLFSEVETGSWAQREASLLSLLAGIRRE